jgi:protein ImuA
MKTAIQPTLFDTVDFDPPVSSSGKTGRPTLPVPRQPPLRQTTPPTETQARAAAAGAPEDTDASGSTDVSASRAASGSGRSPESLVRHLRAQIGCVTTASPETNATFSTGADCVDRLLPRGGLRINGITEWTAGAAGCGAASLAMIAAATRLSKAAGPLVVVGGEGTFYPPAAVSLGVSDDRILWVRPSRHADLVWAIDQSLRCETVAAVWAHVGPHLDDRDARRFQLAAETGNTPGLFIRPASLRGRPSFTDVRFHVTGQLPEFEVAPMAQSQQNHNPKRQRGTPQDRLSLANASGYQENATSVSARRQSRLIHITLDRCRGGGVGRSVLVEVDGRAGVREIETQRPETQRPEITLASPFIDSANNHEAATVRLASELAHPTSAKPARPRRRA